MEKATKIAEMSDRRSYEEADEGGNRARFESAFETT